MSDQFKDSNSLFSEFAKANGISEEKLATFVEGVVLSMTIGATHRYHEQTKPEENQKIASVEETVPVRKVEPKKPAAEAAHAFLTSHAAQSNRVKEYLHTHADILLGRRMTNRELAEILGVEPYVVGNSVAWLQKHRGFVKFVGFADRQPGQLGRSERVFQVVALPPPGNLSAPIPAPAPRAYNTNS